MMVRRALFTIVAVLAAAPLLGAAPLTRGPEKGTLMAIGGGGLTREMVARFVEEAGGRGAKVVYIPTAMGGNLEGRDWPTAAMLERAGCDVTVVHTRDRDEADTDRFVAPIEAAGGVWLSGGRQWRFTDAYLGTRTVEAIRGVLDRGGIVAGSSAGATIQASYMVRGAPQGNHIMMARGREEGFGLLENAAIDQHLIARGRERDLLPVIRRYPDVLGIGIDESTAIVVKGTQFEVIGSSRVAIYDHARNAKSDELLWLDAGDRFDLAERRRLIRVATDAVFAPFHFVSETGALDGFDVALAREVGRRMGAKVELVRVGAYADLFSGLEQKQHDLVAATTGITADRQKKYAFSTPYFETFQVVVVPKKSQVRTLAQLAGQPVGASAGTTSALAARTIGAEPVEREKGTEPLAALRRGDVVAVVADEFEGRALITEHDDLRMLEEAAAGEHYGLVMRLGRGRFVRDVNQALQSMRDDGMIDRLRRRYGLER